MGEHEPLKINEINKMYSDNIMKIISKSDSRIQDIISRYFDDILFINEKALGRGVTRQSGIRVNLKKDMRNVRGSYTTTFHEMGHCVDRAGGGLSYETPAFRNALENDFNGIANEIQRMYNYSQEEAYAYISYNIKGNQYHSISDIVGGLTNNKCVGDYRHEVEYWKKKNKLEKESFAHFFEAFARLDTEKIEALSQMFPHATEQFWNLLEK